MENSGKEVISLILKELGIKAPTFANNIGLKYQRILDIQSGKTKKVSTIVADAIIEKYPQFNRTWLLTGEGDMLSADAPASTGSGDRSVIERLLSQLEEKDRQIAALIELLKK